MIDARARIRRLLAIHFLLFLLLFARRPEVLTKAQFWAEDGAVFFADQLKSGFLHALSSTYAGYYHAVPRLIADAAGVLPARYVPLAYNLTALVLASICCGLFAWPMCRHLIPSDLLRTATCFVAAAGVYGGNEVIGNLANLQWFLLIAAVVLTCYQQTSQAKPAWLHILLAFTALLIALSAPLVLILIPWLLWQAVRKRGLSRLPPLCMLAGSLFEIYTFLRSSEPHGSLHTFRLSSFFVAVVATAISRPVLITLLGHQYLATGALLGLASKFIAALVIVSVALTRLHSSIDRSGRQVLNVATYLCLSLIAVVMLGRNLAAAFTDPEGFRHLEGERYFFVPGLLFVFISAFGISRLLSTQRDEVKATILVLLFSYGIVQNFRLPPLVDLSWATYAPQVDDWAARRRRGEHVPRLTAPINPVPFILILD